MTRLKLDEDEYCRKKSCIPAWDMSSPYDNEPEDREDSERETDDEEE